MRLSSHIRSIIGRVTWHLVTIAALLVLLGLNQLFQLSAALACQVGLAGENHQRLKGTTTKLKPFGFAGRVAKGDPSALGAQEGGTGAL